jgi:predicted ester cyclase
MLQANKLLMSRFIELINSASEPLAEELIHPNATFHVPGRAEPMKGPAGYLAVIAMMRAGFPDIQWTLEEMVAEPDKVAARFTMRGTHSGPFFGVSPNRTHHRRPGYEPVPDLRRADHRGVRSARHAGTAATDRCGPAGSPFGVTGVWIALLSDATPRAVRLHARFPPCFGLLVPALVDACPRV